MTLCRWHHRLVHEGEIIVETMPDETWRFLHPDGRHFEMIPCAAPASNDWNQLARTHATLGLSIDSRTAATRWRGERIDYELGVWTLCQRVELARARALVGSGSGATTTAAAATTIATAGSFAAAPDDVPAETSYGGRPEGAGPATGERTTILEPYQAEPPWIAAD